MSVVFQILRQLSYRFLNCVFRDMLEDITKELDNESNMFDCIPRRNIDLEPFDYQILNYCQLISMKDDTFSTLCKGNLLIVDFPVFLELFYAGI